MKKLIAVAVIALVAQINADGAPAERAQLAKSLLVQRLAEDGWMLTQESQSLITFQKRGGVGETFLIHLLNGANATWAVYSLSFTVIPMSDHETRMLYTISVNSQNVFGQTTSVDVRNKKTDAYITSVMQAASAGLPAKYRSAGVQKVAGK